MTPHEQRHYMANLMYCYNISNYNIHFFAFVAYHYTGLFTIGVLLNFYFAATNNTMAVTTKSNVLFLLH
jgi:hypothetical protein